MATQPHPQPKPEPPHPPPPKPKPDDDEHPKTAAEELKAHQELIKKQAGEPIRTIVDEQREGSAEMEKVGVEAWKEKWYNGPKDRHESQVPGVRRDDGDHKPESNKRN